MNRTCYFLFLPILKKNVSRLLHRFQTKATIFFSATWIRQNKFWSNGRRTAYQRSESSWISLDWFLLRFVCSKLSNWAVGFLTVNSFAYKIFWHPIQTSSYSTFTKEGRLSTKFFLWRDIFRPGTKLETKLKTEWNGREKATTARLSRVEFQATWK